VDNKTELKSFHFARSSFPSIAKPPYLLDGPQTKASHLIEGDSKNLTACILKSVDIIIT